MKAVVLAGGKGTRLRPLTYTRPKPLLPLAGQPAIVHLIRKVAHEGINEIILTTNYFAKQLSATLGDGSAYGVRIHHVEEKSPLGTAGSVKNSEELIDGTFVVVQGDNQFEFDLNGAIKQHRKLGASATMTLIQAESPYEYGVAELTDGRVTRFIEKPKPEECFSNLINTGLYVLEPEVLKLVPRGKPFDFSKNLFPLMLESKMDLTGFRTSGFWVDIGDLQSYLKANIWALDKLEPRRANAEDRITRGAGSSISETATLRAPVHLGKNVRVSADTIVGPYTCLGDDSEVSAGAEVTFSVVYENTRVGTKSILDTCVVAEHCVLGDGVQIGRNAVVGAGTEVGNNSHIAAQSKVGPWTVVELSAVVKGTLASFENKMEKITEILEKSAVVPRLTGDEGRILGALCELGEADAETAGRFVHLPHSRIHSALSGLQARGMVVSSGDAPRLFAPAGECPRH